MKAIKVFCVILVFAIVGVAVAAIIVDDMTSANIESALNSIAAPQNSSIDGSVHKSGKLTPDDTVMRFYGAILVKSSLPLGQLRSYYSGNKPAELTDINVINLSDSKSVLGENFPSDLRFGHHDDAAKGYYIVYSFAEGQMPFPMCDFRSYT